MVQQPLNTSAACQHWTRSSACISLRGSAVQYIIILVTTTQDMPTCVLAQCGIASTRGHAILQSTPMAHA
jgi:hypothetical protein